MATLRFNPFYAGSIMGQLMRMYVFLGIIAFIGVVFIFQEILKLREITTNVLLRSRQIQTYTLRLDGELNHMAYLHYDYLLTRHENLSARAEGIWNTRIKAHQDSLTGLIRGMNNRALIAKFDQLKKDIVLLQAQWKNYKQRQFNADNEAELQRREKDFDLLLNKIRYAIRAIALDKQITFQQGSGALNDTRIAIFNFIIGLLSFILIWGGIHSWFIYRQVPKSLQHITGHIQAHTQGNLHPYSVVRLKEFTGITNVSNELTNVLTRLKQLANLVGQGIFDVDIRPFGGRGEIGNEVTAMRTSLRRIVTEAKERSWFNEGFAKFGEILRNYSQDNVFFDTLITELVKYLELAQGGIFMISDDGEYMDLQASYAFERKKFLAKRFSKEEGLIGRVWREKDIVRITDIPPDYAEITSGLGKARPKSILVVPLLTGGKVMGVIEFASFEIFRPYQIDFIRRLGESIAATMEKIKIDTETQRLLADSQNLADRLKSQEEEMRQSMEELVATQEKVEQNSYEMERQIDALGAAFVMMEMNVNGHFTKVNPMLSQVSGFSERELLNRHYTVLQGAKADLPRFEQEWNQILKGQFIQGEMVLYTKEGKKFYLYEVIYPIFGLSREISKVFAIGYDITIQKEQEQQIKQQLEELQMSKRDVVNRIREVESKAKSKMLKMQMDYQQQLQEKEVMLERMKNETVSEAPEGKSMAERKPD